MTVTDDSSFPSQRPAWPRRKVLTTGIGVAGTAGLAALALPDAAAAAVGMQPQSAQPSRADAHRHITTLDGTWDFLPSSGTPAFPPPDTGWAEIPVPAEWNMTSGAFNTSWDAYDLFDTPSTWDGVSTAWYRRTVTVPASRQGDRIVLRFEAVNFEATVFWNGTQVALHREGLLPFEVDVTDQVVFGGSNTIHVLVRSPGTAAQSSGRYVYPCGSWWGQTCAGIWQDVSLITRSPIAVDDTAIVTSVRTNVFTATTTIRNDGATEATVQVYHAVRDGGRTVLQSTDNVAVPAGGTASVDVSLPWSQPRLWSPDDPYLYDLVVAVGDPAVDTTTTRFGFREVWIDGDQIILNGTPLTLRGDAWHYMGSIENSRAYAHLWMTMAMEAGVNYMRLHAMPYPPVFYDVADELGMLIVAESGIYGSSGNYNLGTQDFWDNCYTHLTGRIVRDRNHPSIIAWSVENEMLAAFGQSYASQVATLKPVATAADASRPAYFEGDTDPGGVSDIQSTHYPLEITSGNTAIPESAYAFAPGQPRAGTWNHTKPFTIGEFSSMYYANPSDVSTIGGPDTYASLDGLWSAHALTLRAQIEGLRYAGFTAISPWNTVWYGMRPLPFSASTVASTNPTGQGPQLLKVGRYAATLNPGFQYDLPAWEANPIHDAVARVFQPFAALAKDYRTHFWASSTLTKVLAVYNGSLTDADLTVAWSLYVGGKPVTGQQQIHLAAATKSDVTASVTVPPVARTTAGRWKVTVSVNGHVEFTDELDVTVYPTSAGTTTVPAGISAAVLETGGSTATSDALAARGVTTRVITDLSTMPAAGEILVISEGSNYPATGDEGTRVATFVQGGGTVLLFAQQNLPQILPWPMFTSGVGQTITHVAAPHHPVLAGVDKDDLRWWQTANEQVVGAVVVKPRFGSLRSIADAGTGQSGSALAECAYGSGTFVICQYPLIADAPLEPVAAVLLHNVLTYAGGRTPTAQASLTVLASASDSALATTLQAASLAPTVITSLDPSGLDAGGILLVDASSGNDDALASVADNAAAVSAWISGGGTLWVNGAQPDALAELGAVLPSLTLTAIDSAHQHAGVVTGKLPFTDGITNADLNWPAGGQPLATYTVAGTGGTSAIDTIAVNWNALATGAEQNKYGAAAKSTDGFVPGSVLWQATSGDGQIVIDQIDWESGAQLPAQVGLAASLAAGLGAAFVGGTGSGLLPTTGWSAIGNPARENPANAYDRNPSTRWSTDAVQVPGMFFQLDLGAVHTVTKVIWDTSQSADDYPRGLDVQTSLDGTTFTSVLTIPNTSSLVSGGVLTIVLGSVTTQYLKFIDTGSAPGNYMSLHEIYVYATD